MRSHTVTMSLASAVLAVMLSAPALAQGARDTGNLIQVVNEPVSSSSVSISDQAFFKTAAIGGMTEIAAGKLALAQGFSDKIKAIAQKLVDDHGKAAAGLKELADSKNITLPDAPDASHQAMLETLAQTHGEAFDAAFLADMKQGHVDAISAFSVAAKSNDGDIAQFAAATLPTLKAHQMSLTALSAGKPVPNRKMPASKAGM